MVWLFYVFLIVIGQPCISVEQKNMLILYFSLDFFFYPSFTLGCIVLYNNIYMNIRAMPYSCPGISASPRPSITLWRLWST